MVASLVRALALLLVLLVASTQAQTNVLTPVATGPGWSRYEMHVYVRNGAPDCFGKNIIMVNGLFQPSIVVEANTTLHVNVFNHIPKDYPTTTEGFTIHWHGLGMRGEASWYDGVNHADQCPIAPGKNFTYSFKVAETPGTYFWHEHSSALKTDGLQGALIITPPGGRADAWTVDGERTLFISDWWHTEGNPLAMRLNRPFDAGKVTNDSGAWAWVGMPQGILMNGKGFYGDCQLFPGNGANSGPTTCNATMLTVPAGRSPAQPWASDLNPGCTHERIQVAPNSTYRLRIILATQLLYMTVCFEGHNVTIIAADGVPVNPYNARCLDLNSGQRFDVLLNTTNAVGNYWISAQQQYRQGAPSGFAVISYTGAPVALPTTATPQPVVPAWGLAQMAAITTHPALLTPAPAGSPWALYQDPQHDLATLAPPRNATRTFMVNVTQPLMPTGMLRWALDNVVHPTSPRCDDYRKNIQKDPKWLDRNKADASYGYGTQLLNKTGGSGDAIRVYELNAGPLRSYPSIGIQAAVLQPGDVVDIVLLSLPANANNGDYRPDGSTRTATEQHPFHLHGHRFWVLGQGFGPYNPANATLNLENPVYRDTMTLLANAWAVIRFKANNPGMWPFHCHIIWHHMMGQQLVFLEGIKQWPKQPKGFPKCPKTCVFNTNPYTYSYVQQRWGYTGYQLPLP